MYTPWPIILLAIALISYSVSKSWKLTIAIQCGLCAIGVLGLWEDTMKTLSIILVATFICIVFGVPIGTLMHNRKFLQAVINPVLDQCQDRMNTEPDDLRGGMGDIFVKLAIIND